MEGKDNPVDEPGPPVGPPVGVDSNRECGDRSMGISGRRMLSILVADGVEAVEGETGV